MINRKHLRPASWSWSMIGGVVVIVAAVVVIVFVVPAKKSLAPTTNTTVDPSAVTITTTDGVSLAATEKMPVRNVLSPVVILLHEYGQDRHQWDPYIQSFIDAGMIVLSYDMRGFGNSRIAAIPSSTAEHLNSLPKDVVDVLAYLKRQPFVDQQHISIIGASVGADVAFVASGSGLGIYRTVLLSPVVENGALDGQGVTDFVPTGVLGLSSQANQQDLQKFMDAVHDPKQQTIVAGGHGMDLLKTDGVMTTILQWIK